MRPVESWLVYSDLRARICVEAAMRVLRVPSFACLALKECGEEQLHRESLQDLIKDFRHHFGPIGARESLYYSSTPFEHPYWGQADFSPEKQILRARDLLDLAERYLKGKL